MGRFVKNTAYALPYGFYLRATFYNKRLFAQAGISGPPKTLDEMADDAKKISAIPGSQMTAAGVLALVPVCVFFLLIQRHLVRGLTAGAVKG